MADAKQIIKRYDAMKSERGTLESHLQEVAELVLPRSSYFNVQRDKGEKLMTKVFDSTAIHANELLASAMVGLNMNPATRWFRGNTTGMDDDSKKYIDNASKIMLEAINSPDSKFYTSQFEYFIENSAFGTSGTFISEHKSGKGIHCQARSLTEFLIAANSDGDIDTVYRRFEWPAHRIFDKWGDNSGELVLKSIKAKKLETKFFIIHAIQPRSKRDTTKKNTANLPIEEAYVLLKDDHILEEGGYHEMPLPVGRFYKSPMETYGRSPAMTALPFVKMLQEIMKTTIKAAQKAVDPALITVSDGFMNPLRTVPGGVNVFDAQDARSIHDLVGQLPSTNPGIGLDFVQMLQDNIRTIFFVDQLQFAGGPTMTATEVLQRTEEKLRLIGPLQGRVQEYLGDVLSRIFGILFRQGAFGEVPENFPAKFDFEYTSQVTMAQKQQEANGFIRGIEVLGPLLELNPNLLLDNINGNKTVRDTLENFGVSQDKFNDEKQVDQVQDLRSQNEQLQQEIVMLQEGAKAAQEVNTATEGGQQ